MKVQPRMLWQFQHIGDARIMSWPPRTATGAEWRQLELTEEAGRIVDGKTAEVGLSNPFGAKKIRKESQTWKLNFSHCHIVACLESIVTVPWFCPLGIRKSANYFELLFVCPAQKSSKWVLYFLFYWKDQKHPSLTSCVLPIGDLPLSTSPSAENGSKRTIYQGHYEGWTIK